MSLCGNVDAAGIRMPLHRFAGTIRRNKHRDDRAHGRLQNPLAQNDVRAGEPSRRWEARWNKWKGHPITSASLGLPASGRHKYRIARRDTGTGSGITQGCGECRRWHRRNRPRPSVGIPCWPAGRPGGQVPVANLGHADQWRWSVEERRSDEGRGSGGSHSARRTPGRQEHAWNSRGRVWHGARCGGVVRRRRRAIADAAGAAERAGECRTGPPACRCGGAAGGRLIPTAQNSDSQGIPFLGWM